MKFKKYLTEEYLGRALQDWNDTGTAEVFVNPSKKELKECGKQARFIVDFKNEKLYVADAHHCIHNEILRCIRKNLNQNFHTDVMDRKFWLDCFAGFASNEVGKLVYKNCAEGAWGYAIDEYVKKKPKFDDTWLKQWFTSPFLQSVIDNKDKLSEEYLGQMEGWFWKTANGSIFKNPSKKEIKECGAEIRFIVDFENHNLYVWDGGVLIHNDVAKFLFDEGEIKSSKIGSNSWWKLYYAGIASPSMGKMKFKRHSDWLENGSNGINLDYSEYTDEEDNWTKQWFIEPLVDSIKEYGW